MRNIVKIIMGCIFLHTLIGCGGCPESSLVKYSFDPSMVAHPQGLNWNKVIAIPRDCNISKAEQMSLDCHLGDSCIWAY